MNRFEFMYELKILDKPLVKTVPVGDTLRDIFLEVNHAAGIDSDSLVICDAKTECNYQGELKGLHYPAF